MEMFPVQGIDSYVGEYRNSECILHFDYGRYSENFSRAQKQPDYQQEAITIDGRAAVLLTATDLEQRDGLAFLAAVAFKDVGTGRSSPGPTRLTMWADCATGEGQQTAVQIFQSIAFPS
jgi:hypothetical protein